MSLPTSVALEDIVAPVETWSPKRDAPNGSFTYIDISAVDQNSKDIRDARRMPCAEAPSRARQIVAAGDVLVSTVRPNLNSVTRIPSEMDGATASTGFCVLRPRAEKLDGSYLFHWVRSPRFIGEMVRRATGASYPAVSDCIVWKSRIPLPHLGEQRRIAEVLDRAEALRAKRLAALAQLDTLTQSIFLDMFGDPVTNPKGWPLQSLLAVCHCYSGGTPSKSNETLWRGATPWFSPKDLKRDDLFDSQDHVSADIPKAGKLKLLPPNTVAIVVRGMILAHTFPVSVLRIPATINQDIKALCPLEPMEPQFLAFCLRAQAQFVLQHVSEAGHGTKRLDADGLSKIRVPSVPLAMQQSFAKRVADVETLRIVHSASAKEFDALFTSLQHRAFRGEL